MTTIQRDGRTWTVNGDGMSNLKRRYTLILDSNNLSANGEFANLSSYGIPAIGSSHPVYQYLKVQSYDVEEGEGSEKKLLKITTNYGLQTSSSEISGEGGTTDSVEEWGWQVGTDQKEVQANLLDDQYASASGQLLNSAGDPFETVPIVQYPAPVFTKVLKSTGRKDWLNLNCKINQNSVTIGSMECEPKTLLASISESRIFGDNKWKYRYTISLHYKSNFANYGAGTTPIEYGWDIPVVDAGMRQLNKDGNPEIIMRVDSESKMPTAVTSPELLDGSGHAVAREVGENPTPYIIRVQAYESESFPAELYSEPA